MSFDCRCQPPSDVDCDLSDVYAVDDLGCSDARDIFFEEEEPVDADAFGCADDIDEYDMDLHAQLDRALDF